jgi:hypothetical protein
VNGAFDHKNKLLSGVAEWQSASDDSPKILNVRQQQANRQILLTKKADRPYVTMQEEVINQAAFLGLGQVFEKCTISFILHKYSAPISKPPNDFYQ